MQYILQTVENNIATITLNRTDVSNALNPAFMQEIISALRSLKERDDFQALVIDANGKNFSAGADLKWMQNLINDSENNIVNDVQLLTDLMHEISTFKKPTIAMVQGKTFGGGIGIIACCDISIASTDCLFCFSEAQLGLIPAVISPYIVKALGHRQAKKLFLTSEMFDAKQALDLGLLHHIDEDLEKRLKTITKSILKCAPSALMGIKELFTLNDLSQITPKLKQHLGDLLSKARSSEEGQRGLKAFLENHSPKG